MKIRYPVTGDRWQVTGTSRTKNLVTRHTSRVTGFTMVEIAICLAIIGIALVAIIGVLPLGINVQKDNREETLVNQDATVFIENIRNGARGLDDLTNYVYAISNSWVSYNVNGIVSGNGINFYGYASFFVTTPPTYPPVGSALTNGANIIGLLSLPEYTDNNGAPIPSLIFGGYSNHVVAFVRSLSGQASEKPPQDNPIILGDSFSFKIICNNLPVAVDTNLLYRYPLWQAQAYTAGGQPVLYNWTYWQAVADTTSSNVPGFSAKWAEVPDPSLELTANLHELRLTFLWPLLPNGGTGNGRHTFATTVAGQMIVTNVANLGVGTAQILYFFQPQSFAGTP
jgi:prepilin-type N-terminal cleavage/methylation domain-containing protein